jgi:hypothetical protein
MGRLGELRCGQAIRRMVPDCNQPLGCRTTVQPPCHSMMLIVLGSRRASIGAATADGPSLIATHPHIDHGVIAQANVIEQWCAAS